VDSALGACKARACKHQGEVEPFQASWVVRDSTADKRTRNHETEQQLADWILLLRTTVEASEAAQGVPCVETVAEQVYLRRGTSACIVCHYKATSRRR